MKLAARHSPPQRCLLHRQTPPKGTDDAAARLDVETAELTSGRTLLFYEANCFSRTTGRPAVRCGIFELQYLSTLAIPVVLCVLLYFLAFFAFFAIPLLPLRLELLLLAASS
jgi:hypothetical protein